MRSMNTKETGGQAFPCEVGPASDHHMIQTGDRQWQQPGMTLRQYAAIKLKVPDSGTDWLDEMITASLRDELASKAMQGMLANPECNNTPLTQVVVDAYRTAYEMLNEREK